MSLKHDQPPEAPGTSQQKKRELLAESFTCTRLPLLHPFSPAVL